MNGQSWYIFESKVEILLKFKKVNDLWKVLHVSKLFKNMRLPSEPICCRKSLPRHFACKASLLNNNISAKPAWLRFINRE